MYTFHANLFGPPPGASEGKQLALRGQQLSTLTTAEGLPLTFVAPLSVTWESAAATLESLPRMIFEMDGSFVWSGDSAAKRWQVDGHLFEFSFDGQPRLHRVELHGTCPLAEFDKLLGCVGWQSVDAAPAIVFELVREGVTLAEEEFRRWAAAGE